MLSAIWHTFAISINHRSDTVVLCAKFQTVWTKETDVLDEQDFAIFVLKMRFRYAILSVVRKVCQFVSCVQHHAC